jgi:hypothetical protein
MVVCVGTCTTRLWRAIVFLERSTFRSVGQTFLPIKITMMILIGLFIILLLLLHNFPTKKTVTKSVYGGKVLMFATSNLIESYGQYTIPWNNNYAQKYNYQFCLETESTEKLSSPAWEKVRMMREALNAETPWVLYIDTDAIFNRPDMSIDECILSHGSEDVLLCSDGPNSNNLYIANGGVILVRNTPGGKLFLDKLWSMRLVKEFQEFAFEQKAIHSLLTNSPNFTFRVCRARAFNSDYATVKAIESTKQWPDDYIVHLMATSNEIRSELFRNRIQDLSNQSDIPSTTNTSPRP